MYDRSQELEAIAEDIRVDFGAKHAAREVGLAACRQALRHSANAIRVVHRGDFPAAEGLLAQAAELLKQAKVALSAHPDIYHAGFVHDAQKEYAEGCTSLALIAGRPLPTRKRSTSSTAPTSTAWARPSASCAATSSTPFAPATSATAKSASPTWTTSTACSSPSTTPRR